VAPIVVDGLRFGDPGDMVTHMFQTSAGTPPITWSNLTSLGPGNPVIAPQLTDDGKFTWDSTGSAQETFVFRVTATNSAGNDIGHLIIELGELAVPEPATLAPLAMALLALFVNLRCPGIRI
jgi:hypothetical protein